MEAKNIRDKQIKFNKAKKSLKSHFIGNDAVIDRVFHYMSAWYYTPELLTRPPVINLWGLTGVGKTDFVRRLVKEIDFQDRFVEIDMQDTSKIKSRNSSISNILSSNGNIQDGETGILLLDEMQGFRTLMETGQEMHNSEKIPLQDVWILLSDGKLPHEVEHEKLESTLWDLRKDLLKRKKTSQEKSDVLVSILDKLNGDAHMKENSEFQSIIEELELEEGKTGKLQKMFESSLDELEEDWGFHNNIYQIKSFKKMFRFKESISEISNWGIEERLVKAERRIEDPDLYGEDDYSKVLVFISGNLDEAYGFTGNDADEVDIDPDVLFEMSKRINIVSIKRALSKRFRKEQIARLGNMHVIYPSISKASYDKIINSSLDNIVKRVKNSFGIQVNIDSSINKLIYSNGVYPAQGTRPVFSTISIVIESNLPRFLMKAVLDEIDKIDIYYDKATSNIVGKVGQYQEKVKFVGDLDLLRTKKLDNKNDLIITTVHEAGHAIAYSCLYKTVPCQIVSACIGAHSAGFVFPHDIRHSKKTILDQIQILLAGRVAEEIVFGPNNVGIGALSDYQKATEVASSYHRRFGFGNFNSYIDTSTEEGAIYNHELDGTNNDIEKIVSHCKTKVESLIKDNLEYFLEFIDALFESSSLSPEEMHKISKKYHKDISILELDEVIINKYYDMYKKFKDCN